jgi:hypothetical protein
LFGPDRLLTILRPILGRRIIEATMNLAQPSSD